MTDEETGQAAPTGGAGPEPEFTQVVRTEPRRAGKQSRLDKMTAEWDRVHERGSE